MAGSRAISISSWVLAVLLAIGFILAAIGKLTGAQTEMFLGWGYAAWFATLIGVLELAGAIGLPGIARFQPNFRPYLPTFNPSAQFSQIS